YEFGAQQFMGLVDPTDQTEDLGNDHIKSGDLGISNLKRIVENLEEWTYEPGDTYDNTRDLYREVVAQYSRHLRHVMPYVGGLRYQDVRQGEDGNQKNYFSRQDQKRAMIWLIGQARSCNAWLSPQQLMQKLGMDAGGNERLLQSVVGCLFSPSALYRIAEGEKADPKNNYSLQGYMDDMLAELFKPTYQGKKLSGDDIVLQEAAIAAMIKQTGLSAPASSGKRLPSAIAYEELVSMAAEPALPCSHAGCNHHNETQSFTRVLMNLPSLNSVVAAPMMTGRLKKIQALYKQKRSVTADVSTRDFYDYQVLRIENVLKK
ncbi:MAG: zinc-dependent metalloprotease, partial [Bacteroidales bacterium]